MGERNEGESCDKLLFSASPQLMLLWEKEKNSFMGEAILEMSVWVSLWEREKNNFMGEAVLEMSVWQIKQLTTAREAVASYAK